MTTLLPSRTSPSYESLVGAWLDLLFALRQAARVAVLGSAVIVFQLSIPHGIDRIAEHLAGLSSRILGV